MDELVQANLELHEELGREVRINLENEAKIKRLERQQARYENDIQYLYSVIEKLESQNAYNNGELHSLRTQLAESHIRLKKSEKLCNEKEKFILFRESQLLESEDIIYKLKRQIHKMASSSSTISHTTTDGTISTLCGNIRGSLAVFYNNSDLTQEEVQTALNNITAYQGQIESHATVLELGYAQAKIECQMAKDDLEKKILELADCVREKDARKDFYENALKESKETYDALKRVVATENAENRSIISKLEISLAGATIEISDKEHEIDRWTMGYDEIGNQLMIANRRIGALNDELGESKNMLRNMLGESERLERNYDQLTNDLQRNLDRARQTVAERDIIINQYNLRHVNCRYERGILTARLTILSAQNRALTRQRMALRIANGQLQIRLMNPPIQPIQPVNQIWLLL